jgi:hypothetical protein
VQRVIDVDGVRLDRWVAGFGVRHGEVTVTASPNGVRLVAADGCVAAVSASFLPLTARDTGPLLAVVEHACAPRRVAVLLVRRGGYACALVDAGRVIASKVGTRYVQSRTAAGGWSQQRFARRREKQAHELEKAVVDVAEHVLLGSEPPPQWLVTGGDRPLVDAVLSAPRLRALARLPRGSHLAIGDPDGKLVAGLPERLRSVTIRLEEAPA